jgi:preprotein translocase subunit YajC
MHTGYGWVLFFDKYVIPTIIVVFLSLFVFCIYMAIRQEVDRQQFIIDHNCKVVARRAGQTVVTTGTNGSVHVGSTSSQTTYVCDDGVEYTW